jgi:hypothetical protein
MVTYRFLLSPHARLSGRHIGREFWTSIRADLTQFSSKVEAILWELTNTGLKYF